jgi:hypothetical protein
MPVKGIPAGAAGPEPEADFRNPGRIPGKLFEQGRNHYILWLIFYPGEKRALDSDEIIT